MRSSQFWARRRRQEEDGFILGLIGVGVVLIAMFLVISMVLYWIGQSQADAATAGAAGQIEVNQEDVQKVINDPSTRLFHAPAIMVEAYVKASVILPTRLAAQPRVAKCRVRWQMIAAIGANESGSGTSRPNYPPYFDGQGDTLAPIRAGGGSNTASGPMQFQPVTWRGLQRSYNFDADGNGNMNFDNAWDSTLGSGVYLCHNNPIDFSTPSSASVADMKRAFNQYCTPSDPSGAACVSAGNPANFADVRVETAQSLDKFTIRYTIKQTGTVSGSVATVIAAATGPQAMGKPYVFATPRPTNTPNPSSFDCSGFTAWAYSHAGVNLTPYTGAQFYQGKHIATIAELKAGDLILFEDPKNPSRGADSTSAHVGLYLGNNEMVDASSGHGGVWRHPVVGYYVEHFIGGTRIFDDNGGRYPDHS